MSSSTVRTDDAFRPLLRPLLFTVIYARLQPRLALESMDSGQARLERILELIDESKFSIHDLSRIEARRTRERFRLNMSFELGIDVGCRAFGNGQHRTKRFLILEKERYRYQAAISDISNCDIGAHNDDLEEVVGVVRDWLNNQAQSKLPGRSRIWDLFNEFMADDYDALTAQGWSDSAIRRLPVPELIAHMRTWLEAL